MSPDELKRHTLFAELTDEEREFVVSLLEERKLGDGRSVFREGSESDGLILLDSGRLKLRSQRGPGVIGTLEAPDHLGAASLFAVGKREVTALADGACSVWILSRSALSRLVDDCPRAAFRLAEAVAAELAGLTRQGLPTLVERERG
jgi:CRP-like cAMP-binding protein